MKPLNSPVSPLLPQLKPGVNERGPDAREQLPNGGHPKMGCAGSSRRTDTVVVLRAIRRSRIGELELTRACEVSVAGPRLDPVLSGAAA